MQEDFAARVKDQVPTVLLTLLSIVQAVALELLWSYLTEHNYLYKQSFLALLGWIQIATTLLGFLLVWLIYCTMVMRFRWIPTTGDMVFPFVVGILEFTLVAQLGPERLGAWFVTMGVVFGAMAWSSQVTLRRARVDGENTAFFAGTNPANLRDFAGSFATVGALLCVGLYLWMSANQGWFALLALSGALTALSVQTWMTNNFWRRTISRLSRQKIPTN